LEKYRPLGRKFQNIFLQRRAKSGIETIGGSLRPLIQAILPPLTGALHYSKRRFIRLIFNTKAPHGEDGKVGVGR
jgi:hypothetical protein